MTRGAPTPPIAEHGVWDGEAGETAQASAAEATSRVGADRRRVHLAVPAILAAAALLGLSYGLSRPLFMVPDELAHLDHAYQLWHGRLATFYGGVQLDPGYGIRAPWQWTSQHPPLFYALEAPVVGPLIDAQRYDIAGYAGRAVSALLAAAAAGGVMWAARCVSPQRPRFWLAAGTVTAVMPSVVMIGGLVYNDNPFVALTAVVLGVTVRMVSAGVTTARAAVLALAASGALLTRFTSVIAIGLCATALAIVVLRRPTRWRDLALLAGAAAVTVLASGWFYLYNEHTSGNVIGGHFEIDHPGRRVRSTLQVLTDTGIWRQWFGDWGSGVVDSAATAWLMVGLPLAAAAVVAAVRLRRRPAEASLVVAAVSGCLVVAVVLLQARYVGMRGGASWRYMMPMLPVVSLAVAFVTTLSRRWTPVVLGLWLLGALLPYAVSTRRALSAPLPRGYEDVARFPGLAVAALLLGVGLLAVAVTLVASIERRGRA